MMRSLAFALLLGAAGAEAATTQYWTLRTAADHSLATRLLGWRPEIGLVDGLGDQIDAHLARVGGARA